jgi:hypothetical protein
VYQLGTCSTPKPGIPAGKSVERFNVIVRWPRLEAPPEFELTGKYQQLFLLDEQGGTESRDVPIVLGRLKCSKTEPAAVLPPDHNQAVMKALDAFIDEVRHRTAHQKFSMSLTIDQTYVLRELRGG